MSMKQTDDVVGRDSDDPMALRARARPHAKPITNSLPPCDQNSRKAVTVEWLLHWAFVREKVHLARLPGLLMGPSLSQGSRDSLSKIGAAVGSSMNLGFEAPADAYAVKRAVEGLGGADTRLVMECALANAAPDWTPHPVITVERGKTGHAWHLTNRGKKSVSAPFRLFKYRGDLPEIVETRRAVYLQWADAVRRVHAVLSEADMLADHELTAEKPALRPWLDAR